MSSKICMWLIFVIAQLIVLGSLTYGQAAPCNWLDCVDSPSPTPYPTPAPDSPDSLQPEYSTPPPEASQPSVPYSPEASQPSVPYSPEASQPSVPYSPETSQPSVPYSPEASQPSVPYSPEAAVVTQQPVPPINNAQPAGPLCSNPDPDPSPVNKLAKWCEMDQEKLFFKPQAVKPRFFPGTTFEEGYGSPSMNETRLKVEYYSTEGRYVINAVYDSGDDKPYSSVQFDLTLGLLRVMPFAFNKNGRQQAVLNYDLRTLDPSFFVALSTRDGFKSAFAPVSEALEFLDRILQRFQAPYNPSPEIAMPMQRTYYCPDLASVSLYLREIRGTVGL